MTTARFSTWHPNYGHGFFLSKPGIHVYDPTPENFLLHSSFKQEQILTAGHRAINAFNTVHVPFPVALPSVPIVYFNYSRAGFGQVQLPYDQGVKSVPAATASLTVNADVSTTGVSFGNTMNVVIQLYYIVMLRSMD